jgi:3'(2'), 5'-bisphosphate nucleotidase
MDWNLVIDIAHQAGQKIMEVYHRKSVIKVQNKSDNSPLTEADLASHCHIENSLKKLFPHIPILSEESVGIEWGQRKSWERYWLVDPLDGTKEFVKRNGEFTVNIALIEKHQPVWGVVYAPVLETTWTGGLDSGAFKIVGGERKKIVVDPSFNVGDCRVVGSRSHVNEKIKNYLAPIGEHELIPMGSSIKLCLIADGSAQLYPRLGPTSEWDTAAAHAVVCAAGGAVLTIDGYVPLEYNRKESILNDFFIAVADRSFISKLGSL